MPGIVRIGESESGSRSEPVKDTLQLAPIEFAGATLARAFRLRAQAAQLGLLLACETTGLGLQIHGLGQRRRLALQTAVPDFDLAAFARQFDQKHITDTNLLGGLGRVAVHFHAAQFALRGGQSAGLEPA